MSRVYDRKAVEEAFFDAWFFARPWFFWVVNSVQDASIQAGFSTAFSHEAPRIENGIWVNSTPWMVTSSSTNNNAAVKVQDFISGVANRRIWVDRQDVNGHHTGIHGPLGEKSFLDLFREALEKRALSQSKSRARVRAIFRDGSSNAMNIRVPHL